MNKYRVKAFTIFEMVITMMITAIVIGIAYTSYSIVVKSYNSFNNKNNDMAVVINLDHLLKRDFERAETILKDTDGIALNKGTIRSSVFPSPILDNINNINISNGLSR